MTRPRPSIHFAPVANWVNDPNGLIFWRGRHHLFYQYNPFAPVHGNICWGHAVSDDLVRWEDLPVALEPTMGSVDEDGCWSGCATVYDNSVYILYTALRAGRQRPCLARGVGDDLSHFEKFVDNPVIRDEPLPDLTGFRDHCVWWSDGVAHQLIGAGSRDAGGCVFEYRSQDLVTWDFSGVFLSADGVDVPGDMWECPDLVHLDGRWFLIVSAEEQGVPIGVFYVEGLFEDDGFVPVTAGRLDGGSRWYAAQSFTVPLGRRVAFGWLRESPSELPPGLLDRVGIMSLPRELIVGPSGQLTVRPARELETLRARRLPGGPDGRIPLSSRVDGSERSPAIEIEARSGSALCVMLYDVDGGLVLAASASGSWAEISPSGVPELPDGRDDGAATSVRMFFDEGICELFTSSGPSRSEIFYGLAPVKEARVAVWRDGPLATGDVPEATAWELVDIWDKAGQMGLTPSGRLTE